MAYEVRKKIDVDIDIEDCISELRPIELTELTKKLVKENLELEEVMECFSNFDIDCWIEDNAERYGYVKSE